MYSFKFPRSITLQSVGGWSIKNRFFIMIPVTVLNTIVCLIEGPFV